MQPCITEALILRMDTRSDVLRLRTLPQTASIQYIFSLTVTMLVSFGTQTRTDDTIQAVKRLLHSGCGLNLVLDLNHVH